MMLDVDYVLSWLDLDAAEELDDEPTGDPRLARLPHRDWNWSADDDATD